MKSIGEILRHDSLSDVLARASIDFKFFVERIMSGTLEEELKIKPFHIQWYNYFLNSKRTCIIAARGTGKTTTLGVAFPLHISFFNRHKDFLVVSNAMHQSVDIIKRIRDYIEENELLKKLRPPTYSATWSKTELNTNTHCRIIAKPYNPNLRGGHYHYVLCDEGSLYADLSVYFRSVVPTVNVKNGNIMVIGTPTSQTDLLARLGENPEYVVKSYPIIKGNRLLWREKYSLERLERIKSEISPDNFSREYLCNIVDEAISPFPYRMLVRAFDPNLRLGTPRPSNYVDVNKRLGESEGTFYVGADFALAAKGDYSAFVVVEKRRDNKIQIVDIYRRRGMPFQEQLSLLKAIHFKYHPVQMLLDKSTFGEVFLTELKRENLPVRGFSFTQENRNSAFNIAIRKFQEENIVIPYDQNHGETVSKVDVLINELTSFVIDKTRTGYATYISRGKNDDVAIAFLLAIKTASVQQPFLSYIRAGRYGEERENQRKNVKKEEESSIIDIVTR